jgi:hypothetical protein
MAECPGAVDDVSRPEQAEPATPPPRQLLSRLVDCHAHPHDTPHFRDDFAAVSRVTCSKVNKKTKPFLSTHPFFCYSVADLFVVSLLWNIGHDGGSQRSA